MRATHSRVDVKACGAGAARPSPWVGTLLPVASAWRSPCASRPALHHPGAGSRPTICMAQPQSTRDRVVDSSSIDAEGGPPHHTESLPDTPGNPARLLTDAVIVANVAVFGLQVIFPELTLFGVKANELINAGQWWRFITPAFLHGSPLHLLVNMISLAQLGPITEWTCGRQRFAAIYVTSAVAGNVLSYFGDPNPALGASGAIFGLAGALAVYFQRNRRLFGSRFDDLQRRLWLVIALNLVTGLVLPQIDEWGHLGGLLGGGAIAFLLGPSYELCLVKGRPGVWLIDEPPIEALATPPRKVLG